MQPATTKGSPLEARLLGNWQPSVFAAIDFETANRQYQSACSVAVVRVENGKIVKNKVELIRPPTDQFEFSNIHGIRWSNVKGCKSFKSVWQECLPLLEGAEFFAAHNAKFDEAVLSACCRNQRITPPPVAFVCTVSLARQRWNLFPTKLPDVCKHLSLALNHHNALSDAEACARIVLAVMQGTSSPQRQETCG